MDKVGDNHEPLQQETEYLTRSPANAQDLMLAVEEITERKNWVKHALTED